VPGISKSERVGEDFHFAATATALDLTTISGKPQRCARRIVALAAGNWTLLKNHKGVDAPFGAVPEGFVHDADTSVITSSAAIAVYW
jgi:hypothetical protein